MSEKGKRAAPNGPSLGKAASTSDGKKFAAGLQKIVSDLEALCKSNDGVQDYGNLLGSQVVLKQEAQKWERKAARLQTEVEGLREKQEEDVQKLQREISDLKQHKDHLMVDYREKYKVWDADKRRHTDDLEDLARLRKELEVATIVAVKAKAENEDLYEQRKMLAEKFEKYQSEVTALKERGEMKELELKRTNRKLDEYRKKAKEAKDQLGILPLDIERCQQELGELASGLHELMWDYFGNQILQPIISVDISGTMLVQIPQPASNSPAARAIRCALAEALVARELSQCIFTDLVSNGASGIPLDEFARVLTWLDSSHPLEAIITRCQLARAVAKSSGVEHCASQATERVCAILGPWLGSDDRRQRFAANLAERFEAAAGLWLPLRRAEQRVRAGGDLASDDWLYEEDKRPKYDDVVAGVGTHDGGSVGQGHDGGQGHDAASEFPLAVLFPHVYVSEKIVFHGLCLFAAQPAVAAARLELRSQPDMLRANRASYRRNSHHYQLSGQPARGGRKTSISSTESRTGGSLVGGAAASDLSSVPRGRVTDVSALGSTRSQRSGGSVNHG